MARSPPAGKSMILRWRAEKLLNQALQVQRARAEVLSRIYRWSTSRSTAGASSNSPVKHCAGAELSDDSRGFSKTVPLVDILNACRKCDAENGISDYCI